MAQDQPGRSRAKAAHLYFTDAEITKCKPRRKQYLLWDAWTDEAAALAKKLKKKVLPSIARGLCVLVSPKGAKSFRAVFYYPGSAKPHYLHLGRVNELSLVEARRRCGEVRKLAIEGADPAADNPVKSDSFEKAFGDFIQHVQIGERQNKSALKTKSFVLKACATWLPRPVATIRPTEIESLLWEIRDGNEDKGLKKRPAAAIRTFAHLQDFFGWCARSSGPIKISPMSNMKPPGSIAARERFYTDDEIKAIWAAAEKLDPSERHFVKLIILLALRREELAQAQWSEFKFDDEGMPTLFTVPFERTKGKINRKRKITYVVPLPPLAQRQLTSLRKSGNGEMLFSRIDFTQLKDKLVSLGAPKDFTLHTARHTAATWLQNKSHSEWEIGLVLNHAASGVTAGYSHGYPVERKRELLSEWAGHVERLVQPEGITLLL